MFWRRNTSVFVPVVLFHHRYAYCFPSDLSFADVVTFHWELVKPIRDNAADQQFYSLLV